MLSAPRTFRPLLPLVVLLTLAGCDHEGVCDENVPTRSTSQDDAAIGAVVAGNDEFAAALHQRLAAEGGNVFTSPFSVSAALAMTYAGARGQTATEMHDLLGVNLEDAAFHEAFGGLMADLDQEAEDGCFAYTLGIGNRLYGQDSVPFEADFVGLTRDAYGAELQPVDFVGDTEGTRGVINQWVSDQTAEKIPELLTSLSADSVLVLVNAVYFKGRWATAFDPANTSEGTFHAPGGEVQAPLMAAVAEFGYAQVEGAQVLSLPYLGEQISMYVVVPDETDGLANVEATMTGATIAGWIAAVAPAEVDVVLPKLELRYRRPLVEDLQALGMSLAFDASQADFSGMAAQGGLYVSEVIHEAYVMVDEEGTEAAAATAVEMEATSEPAPGPQVHADHPFLFMIVDDVTGSVLFMGRIEDPS